MCSTETCQGDQICKVLDGIQDCYPPDRVTCHIYGDPHYFTFDGKLYHFQGSCNYTAVETCTVSSNEQFSVTTRNEHRGSATWTALNSVAVSFKDLHIALRKNREVYVSIAHRVEMYHVPFSASAQTKKGLFLTKPIEEQQVSQDGRISRVWANDSLVEMSPLEVVILQLS